MALWAKRGKWRLWQIREVSLAQLELERAAIAHRGQSAIGIPYAYAVLNGQRYFAPEAAPYVQIEDDQGGTL